MRHWLERVAALVVILLMVAVLLACWMPAYVGATGGLSRRPARAQRDHAP